MKRTFQPKKRHVTKVHGFRKRMQTKQGRQRSETSPQQRQSKTYPAQLIVRATLPRTMQKEYKLKKRASFNYIYRKGTVFSNDDFVLYTVKTKGALKVGFSVSKKVGGSVQRNRVKRQMRESVRLMIPEITPGYNIIFVARSTVYGKKSSVIADSMRSLLKKAGLLGHSL